MRGRKVTASITVEATFMMPIFIFVVAAFLFFFQLFTLQEKIQESITRVSKDASQYGYVYEQLKKASGTEVQAKESTAAKKAVKGLLDGTLFRTKFLEYMGKETNDGCIVGGIEGVLFLDSSFMKQGKEIEVVASYLVKIPVLFVEVKPFRVVQRVRSRALVGQSLLEGRADGTSDGKKEKEEDEYVYITRTGTKYHKSASCTYLKVRLSKVSGSQIAKSRNQGGAKYYPCESCMAGKKAGSGTYYITEYGTRYHSSASCNKIERDVTRVKKSEVGSRGACSKCG